MAVYGNFGTEGTHLADAFPGVKFHLCTLVGNFWVRLGKEEEAIDPDPS